MLFTLEPLAVVAAAVRPLENAVAVFLVILVLADVLPSIIPRKHPMTIHPVINPDSVKNTTISPNVLATAVNVVVYKVAFERALVCPDELAFALLFTIHVFTTVLGTVGPFFHALTVLLVI